MTKFTQRTSRFIALPLGLVAFARMGYVNGPVSFSPASEEDWVEAALNRPLVTGERLWADAGARAELQISSATARLGATTSLTLINLDDRVLQLQLTQGTLNVRVRRLELSLRSTCG